MTNHFLSSLFHDAPSQPPMATTGSHPWQRRAATSSRSRSAAPSTKRAVGGGRKASLPRSIRRAAAAQLLAERRSLRHSTAKALHPLPVGCCRHLGRHSHRGRQPQQRLLLRAVASSVYVYHHHSSPSFSALSSSSSP